MKILINSKNSQNNLFIYCTQTGNPAIDITYLFRSSSSRANFASLKLARLTASIRQVNQAQYIRICNKILTRLSAGRSGRRAWLVLYFYSRSLWKQRRHSTSSEVCVPLLITHDRAISIFCHLENFADFAAAFFALRTFFNLSLTENSKENQKKNKMDLLTVIDKYYTQ